MAANARAAPGLSRIPKAVNPLGLDTTWIVFRGAEDTGFHEAARQRALNWEKEGAGRHVGVVNVSPTQKEMDKAWKHVARSAVEDGKVILTGHGSPYDGGVHGSKLEPGIAGHKKGGSQFP